MKIKYPKIPKHEMDALAHVMLPAIQEFFQSEEGKREFEAWKREQETQHKQKKVIAGRQYHHDTAALCSSRH